MSGLPQMLPWGIIAILNLTTFAEGAESFSAPNQTQVRRELMIDEEFEDRNLAAWMSLQLC